jgi:hypothetical protein
MTDDVEKSINKQNMQVKRFTAKRVYPSEKGIHLVFATTEEASVFYEDSLQRGITSNELDGVTVIKRFKKTSIDVT